MAKVKKPITLYLAHPVEMRHYALERLREYEKIYNIKIVSPFYEIYRKEILILDSLKTKKEMVQYKKTWTRAMKKKIVEIDLELIRECDGVLAYIPYPTIGTSMEIQFAHDIKKPIYIISRKRYSDHAWISTYKTEVFPTFSSFNKWLLQKEKYIRCNDCKKFKLKKEYYNLKSGHYRCKKCCHIRRLQQYDLTQKQAIEYTKKWAIKNKKRIKEYERNRSKMQDNSIEMQCRHKVAIALRSNKIRKKRCNVCGKLIVEAHHEDYSKPLKVIWLCHTHHMELHRKMRRDDGYKKKT